MRKYELVIRSLRNMFRYLRNTILVPKVLVLYLERPRAKSWELRRRVGGASDTALSTGHPLGGGCMSQELPQSLSESHLISIVVQH
jgi:hypothetical protein